MPPERHSSKYQTFIADQVFDAVRLKFGFSQEELMRDKGTRTTEAKQIATYLFQEAGIPKDQIGHFLHRSQSTVEDSLREISKRIGSDLNFKGKVDELGERVDVIKLRRDFVRIRPDLTDRNI